MFPATRHSPWAKGIAPAVVEQRRLCFWIGTRPFIWMCVCSLSLFGQSLEAIQAKFELRKKQTEALRSIIPRCDAKPKPTISVCKPVVPPPPPPELHASFGLSIGEATASWSSSTPLSLEQGSTARPHEGFSQSAAQRRCRSSSVATREAFVCSYSGVQSRHCTPLTHTG